MKTITIPGCTVNLTADDKPAVAVFGLEGSGKTRLALTMEGSIGYIAIDRKAKRTMELVSEELGLKGRVHVNSEPFLSDDDTRKLAALDSTPADIEKAKKIYSEAIERVFDLTSKFANHEGIDSIAVDRVSQYFDWIKYGHHGRKLKIDPKTGLGPVNQYMIDYINMCKSKNLLLINGAKEIWAEVRDAKGNSSSQPTGKYRADGFPAIGSYVMANLELFSQKLTSADRQTLDADGQLAKKFRARVQTCQAQPLLEGYDLVDYGLAGKTLTWEGLLSVMGAA